MEETREGRAAEVVVVAVGAAEASGIAGAGTIRVVMSGGSRGAEVREVVVEAKGGTGARVAVGEVIVEAKEEVVAGAAEAGSIADAVTIRVVVSGGSRGGAGGGSARGSAGLVVVEAVGEEGGMADAETMHVTMSGGSRGAEVGGLESSGWVAGGVTGGGGGSRGRSGGLGGLGLSEAE